MTQADAIKVYTRIVKQVQNTETKDYDTQVVTDYVPYFHAWYDQDGKASTVLLSGFGENKVAPTAVTVTKKDKTTETWYCYDYGDLSSSTGKYYKVIVAAYPRATATNKDASCAWQSANLDVYNDGKKADEDIYLEVEYMPYKASDGTDKSRWSVHYENQYQAEGYDLKYYLCDKDGKHLATFQNVRNQMAYLKPTTTTTYDSSNPEIISHPENTSLWNCGFLASTLPSDGKFYISGGYYDDNNAYQEIYQYRPWSNYAFNSNMNFKQPNGYSDYGNCKIIDGVTTARNTYFTVGETTNSGNSNAADVSYTLYLSTSWISTASDETNQGWGGYPKNQKMSVWKTIDYGNQSVTLQRNAALTEDANGYDLLVNMVQLRPEDKYENQEGATGTWDVTKSSRTMTKINWTSDDDQKYVSILKQYPDFCATNDIVYHYRVPKPQSDFESLFMAFLPNTVKNNWTTLMNEYNSSTETDATKKDKLNPWNKIIRPQVQEGKTAKGLMGGVFIPEHNAMEALTPNLPNSNYTQFDVFLNVSKSMYLLVPVNSYDLTGPAVRYYNTSSHNFEESTDASHWGNGQYQYQYTPLVYNKKENCWTYTGKFFHSINRNEDGTLNNTDGGFRIRVNQLYTTNYHEEPYWFSSQNANETKENIVCHKNQTYAQYIEAQTDTIQKVITTRPMPSTVPEWTVTYTAADGTTKTVHNPNGPDSYYYNHLVTCNSGRPLFADAKNVASPHNSNDGIADDGNKGKYEEQQRININFDLPDGWYTIKFYPQGDKTGKPYYTLQDAKDPGVVIPKPIHNYAYLRTYSANKAYVRPADMDVYTVTDVTNNEENNTATLHNINSLGYLPANTGLIIAYKTDISTADTTDLDFSTAGGGAQYKDIATHYPKLSLTEYIGSKDKESQYTANNLLKPTTQEDGTTISSIPTTVMNDDGTVKARNYGFYLKSVYKDDARTTIDTCYVYFMRVRTWTTDDKITQEEATKRNTPTAERAYLSLPSSKYGGTKYGDKSFDGFGDNWESMSNAQYSHFYLNFDGDENNAATAISTLPEQTITKNDKRVYNLMGTVVSGPLTKGIYIQNGKKFVIR